MVSFPLLLAQTSGPPELVVQRAVPVSRDLALREPAEIGRLRTVGFPDSVGESGRWANELSLWGSDHTTFDSCTQIPTTLPRAK